MSVHAQASKISVYYHTHWDREWYLPFRAYQIRLAEVVDAILERLETGVLSCFTLDGQTVVLDDYLELRPNNRTRLQHLIEKGQLSIGPWYVMPDEFLVSGESLIRNLKTGILSARAWGHSKFTGYLPDTFGHSADIPTILQQFGIESAVVWRGVQPQSSLFQWKSPGGAQVLTGHLTDGYFQMVLQDWMLAESERQKGLHTLVEKLQAATLAEIPILLPIGGDHFAPLTQTGHELLTLNYPKIVETTPEHYLAEVANTKAKWPTIQGELLDNSGSFLLRGVYSSRMYLKQANRRLEHGLVQQLEPLLALTQFMSQSLESPSRYPAEELDLAWKTLLLNHPHDSICGCSVDAVHRENEVRFDQVEQLSDALMARATHHLAIAGDKNDWVIFHTGDQPYTGVVPVIEDTLDINDSSQLLQIENVETVLQDEYQYDIGRVPQAHLTKLRRTGWIWVDNLRPFSVTAIPKNQVTSPLSVKVQENTLENEYIHVQVTLDGILIIRELETGMTYPGLLRFKDQGDQGDSYNSAPIPGHSPEFAKFETANVIANGPLVGILELSHHFAASNLTLTTQIRLDAGSPVLQFKTSFVNQTTNHKLQVGFETGKPTETVWAESHLSIIERQYDANYCEADHMPPAAWRELKTNTGPIQRFFSVNGQSFITEGLCEYEVFQSKVWITLLRAFSHLSKADTGVRGAQAGPPFETPEGQCLNRTFDCTYAWTSTPKQPESLYTLANQFYGVTWGQSGVGEQTQENLISLLQLDDSALVTTACYYKPSAGLVVRLLNPTHRSISTTVKPGFQSKTLWALSFLEEPQNQLADWKVTIPPLGVQTLLFAV